MWTLITGWFSANALRLIGWGVDGLITDFPDRARDVMRARGLPLVEGCIAWLECRLIAEPHAQDTYDTFFGEVVKSTTCAPKALANLTPMWPRPPRPMMPTFMPGPTFQWRSGE